MVRLPDSSVRQRMVSPQKGPTFTKAGTYLGCAGFSRGHQVARERNDDHRRWLEWELHQQVPLELGVKSQQNAVRTLVASQSAPLAADVRHDRLHRWWRASPAPTQSVEGHLNLSTGRGGLPSRG